MLYKTFHGMFAQQKPIHITKYLCMLQCHGYIMRWIIHCNVTKVLTSTITLSSFNSLIVNHTNNVYVHHSDPHQRWLNNLTIKSCIHHAKQTFQLATSHIHAWSYCYSISIKFHACSTRLAYQPACRLMLCMIHAKSN